jgi:transposase
LKTLAVKLKPTSQQRKKLDEWLNTSRYVYNKTVQCIRGGDSVNFYNLRDKLVTADTKKHNAEYIELEQLKETKRTLQKEWNVLNVAHVKKEYQDEITKINTQIEQCKRNLETVKKTLKAEKNKNIQEWELETPKDIRAAAVDDVCKAHKTALANLKAGNIKHFNINYKRKTNARQCMLLPKSAIKNKEGELTIYKQVLKGSNSKFSMGKRTKKKYKDLVIQHDCRIVKHKNVYWLFIPIPLEIKPAEAPTEATVRYCGVDPGIRTLFTSFERDGCTEYNYKENLIRKLDEKIRYMKSVRCNKRRRVHKRKINKIETRKSNLINELHWKSINHLLKSNDVIFFGDIKSHSIVKGGKNRTLNRDMNNIKFYQLKQRLQHKATERCKKLYFIREEYTTKTCSFCGAYNDPKASKEYSCSACKIIVGRDVNAAKNILMKGIMSLRK